ncbi:MAG: VWA domain-containing protein [Acidobacteriota bacterium]
MSPGRAKLFAVIAILAVAACCAAGQAPPTPRPEVPTDLILVVDTSRTMIGEAGGQNIFPEVKRVLKELIEKAAVGDNVVLIAYDATVDAYPTTLINDREDKERLKVLIDQLRAKGDWTYTAAAIQAGMAEARRLHEAQGAAKHTKAVILLTDGINNPPPSVRGTSAEVRLEEVARRYAGMPWFVWQVQLGPQVDQDLDKAFREAGFPNYETVKTPAEDLDRVRQRIQNKITAEQARREAEEAERRKRREAAEAEARRRTDQAAERRARMREVLHPLGVGVGAAVLLLAAWVWHRRRPRPHGTLSYWRAGERQATFDLGSTHRRRIRIDGPGSDLVLAGFDARGATVRAERVEGEVLCVIEADDGVVMKFRGNPVGRLELHDLDEFQLADYTLRYQGEVSARPR